MPRKKEYIEEEVIEKALALFWVNGYKNTSMQLLEKTMGINKFSIYSSFGSKKGVFLKCLQQYRNELLPIMNTLKNSNNGITGIKEYFFDYLNFTKMKDSRLNRGCFVINTFDELSKIGMEPDIQKEIEEFTNEVLGLFRKNLKQAPKLKEDTIDKKSEYLLMSKVAMVTVSKLFNEQQLKDYVNTIFKIN